MFCRQCGNELKEGAAFCANCGARQDAPAAAPVQNAEPDLEKTVGVFSTVPGVETPMQQPVYQEPVQQPVYQEPVQQPVYQEPVQQQPVQPVYQVPAQSQNTYQPNTEAAPGEKVSFGEAIKRLFRNYANFRGRASKSEFWWGFLFLWICNFAAAYIPYVGAVISLALFIPNLSLCIRRLHDIGKSWTWYLMGLIPLAGFIILIVYYCKESVGDNQWGPGPVATVQASSQFVNTPVNYSAPAPRAVTDNDIYAMAQNHEPVDLSTADAKRMMDSALGRIIPTYTGIENLAGAMMLCDPQSIKASIAATDTDTLLVIFKALGFYIGQGCDANVLGMVQQNVLATLKTRY